MDKPSTGILELPFKFDPVEITSYIKSLTEEEWLRWRFRQTLPNHQHTESIKVLWPPRDVVNFDLSAAEKNDPYHTAVSNIMKDCFDFLTLYYGGEIYKIIIVKLAPHSHIKSHDDVGFWLEIPHRVHIPIVSNPDIKFGCGQSEIYMKPGDLYEINNQQMHYVKNDTDQHRIHIIVDVIENSNITKT